MGKFRWIKNLNYGYNNLTNQINILHMSPKSNFTKQTLFLIPALLLTTVPFWSFIGDASTPILVLIFWSIFVILVPIATILLLIIKHRLNNGGNIILTSKALRVLMYFAVLVFSVMLIGGIYAMYDLGITIMLHAVDDMPVYILSNFIANILIISLLCFAIRYNRLTY